MALCNNAGFVVPRLDGIEVLWAGDAAVVERALRDITEEELETLCDGEEGEALAIAGRSAELTAAYNLLGQFFCTL